MLEAIIQGHEPLGKFLGAFRGAFKNRPQYRHFQAYVVALLIYLGSRNLAGLSRAIPDGRSACSLYRFVAEMAEGPALRTGTWSRWSRSAGKC